MIETSPTIDTSGHGWRGLFFRRKAPSKFLVISIAVHLLFALGAAYLIVQVIPIKRKLTFQAGPRSPNPSTRAIEYKVQTAKRQQMTQVPMTAKRILSTGLARVSLPELPKMPDTVQTTAKMMGAGGAGLGFSMDAASAGGTGGNVSVSIFGFRPKAGQTGLLGTFYDLKQDRNGKPTKMAIADQTWGSKAEEPANTAYYETLSAYCRSGWNSSVLDAFFKGSETLSATQLFIPMTPADDGPAAFNLASKVKPRRWVIHYQGKVVPPEGGRYRFVGFGDDVLVAKFNGAVVLDAGYVRPSGTPRSKQVYVFDGLTVDPKIGYDGCEAGTTFQVTAGSTYPIDVIIGEAPGGSLKSWLLLEKEGATYEKDSKGNPRLPIFKVSPSGPPPSSRGEHPVVGNDTSWSVWKCESSSPGSSFFGP